MKNRITQNLLIFLLSSILVLSFSAQSQTYLSDIEFDKIEEETVVAYLYNQIENNVETFTEIEASLGPVSSIKGFEFHEKEFLIKDSLEKVWRHYVHTNPMKAWNTSKLNFGFMFSKKENEMVYPNQNVEQVEIGQIIYLNFNLMKIKNMATAFEIITVDKEKGIIEFSYIEDNTTHGKQQMNFEQTAEGFTKIIHRSYFKSGSPIRDRYFYPYFHTRLINAYHRNMKKLYFN
jgi:hypothetical protein